jgi:oxygen-independent coproporphyrinogen-3 oxidase
MSVGVQDFDAGVQQAVNRLQSEEETCAVIDAARAAASSRSASTSSTACPNRRSPASPHARPGHRRQPGSRLDLQLCASAEPVQAAAPHPRSGHAIRRRASADPRPGHPQMTEAGYVFIGMDHFAKPDDELAVAQRQGRLHRNFQGYSTHSDCDLLAFGISSISKVGPTYSQNVKTLDEYYDLLDSGTLPVYRGIELNADDLLRRSIIQSLMCHFELSIESIEIAHLIDFRKYFATELDELREMVDAGLVRVDDRWITVLPRGRMLVRAISMVFDRYLRADRQRTRYSKVI